MVMIIVFVMTIIVFLAIFAAFVMTTAVLMMKFAASVVMLIGFVAMNAVFGMMLIVMN